jgi:hypothetical protein
MWYAVSSTNLRYPIFLEKSVFESSAIAGRHIGMLLSGGGVVVVGGVVW